MLAWCTVLFVLGILAILDSQFNYGYLFRTANSFLFMLVSLGLLVRTRYKAKIGLREQMLMNHEKLMEELNTLRAFKDSKVSADDKEKTKEPVAPRTS
jgi:hypothetical protein